MSAYAKSKKKKKLNDLKSTPFQGLQAIKILRSMQKNGTQQTTCMSMEFTPCKGGIVKCISFQTYYRKKLLTTPIPSRAKIAIPKNKGISDHDEIFLAVSIGGKSEKT